MQNKTTVKWLALKKRCVLKLFIQFCNSAKLWSLLHFISLAFFATSKVTLVFWVAMMFTLFLFIGVISNTIALNFSVSHSYILSVVAFDCGQKRSEPLLVTVEVKKACSTGWSGKKLSISSESLKFVPDQFGLGPFLCMQKTFWMNKLF